MQLGGWQSGPSLYFFAGKEFLVCDVNSGIGTVTRQALSGGIDELRNGSTGVSTLASLLLTADVRGNAMYLDVIMMLLIAVAIPIFTAITFLGKSKKRRHRRPVKNFR
jgi:hypothetical protein